ncbi:methyltransferase [Actinomadura miaoliensis]|uniref:Methyltransferase n=2 Tax=Actinomadura miaoliensis TaxID=430685 RepID=A0ABP7V7R9_9ACTN
MPLFARMISNADSDRHGYDEEAILNDSASDVAGGSPELELAGHALAYLRSVAVHAVARLRVADHLAGGPRTAAELAELTGTDAPYLERVLHFMASLGLFAVESDGRFRLTPRGEPLRSDVPNSMRASVLTFTDEAFWAAFGRLVDAVRLGRSVFADVNGAPFFDYLNAEPEVGMRFADGMSRFSHWQDPPVAAAYDFPEKALIVDVGGGRGGLLAEVLRRNPAATGVLFDQEQVLAGGHVLDVAELRGRWRTEGGDFFDTVTPGGDVYLLKYILHDWTDDECVRLLKVCRAAMADGGRVLAIDAVLPPGGTPHFGRTLDMLMMTVLNGRERTRADFEALFNAAGLRLTRVIDTPTPCSIVEGVAA